jgi:hypothetical protein
MEKPEGEITRILGNMLGCKEASSQEGKGKGSFPVLN